MQYFVVERYQDCIALLRTHDICGVNWRESPWPHFSGNVWWATSDYIKRLIPLDSLPPITGKDQGHRHQCERWIGSGAEVQPAVLHLSKIDHYASRYPRNLYADPKSTAPASQIDSLPLLDANDAAQDIFRSQRVAMIFDNAARPNTTGFYCLRACEKIAHVSHIQPSALAKLRPGDFDLYLYIDDGLDYPLRSDLHPSAIWAIDALIQPECLIRRAGGIDHVFAAQRDGVGLLRQHGINYATWLPLACDPDIHRQHRLAKQWDTCFVSDLNSKKRQELAALIQNRIPKCFVGQRFSHEMAMAYSASRTVLNLSFRNDVNVRIFEALGCGSLLITNDLTENGLSELFVFNKHFVVYRDFQELIGLIERYLADDKQREHIAASGRKAVLLHHTYVHRMRGILSEITRRFGMPTIPVENH
ncbi:MAG TPA: glycosyltransferase [Phycisphaerae bacterium]|nr:glycosyltransferase [Phycisphaerae bacterium]